MIINLKSVGIVLCWMSVGIFCSCHSTKSLQSSGLKTKFANDFLIGAAVNVDQINQKDPVVDKLIKQQFSSLTPENIMKCEVIHPEWSRYDFTMADKLVEYGRQNKMAIMGHALVWHEQLAPFVQKIQSKDSFKLFFDNHITTVASHFKGKIQGWDVINEALAEDGTIRKTVFLNKLGEDYLVDAFKLAEKAAPGCELYYNDYNIERSPKRQGAINIVNKIKASGARIDGIGIQGHWGLLTPSLEDIETSIVAFSKLGLKVMITEFDISVLVNPYDLDGADISRTFENTPATNPYTAGLPEDVAIKLAQRYEDIFKIFLKHQDKISRVTFWGVNDDQSWLNNWPIKGRTNYPLFFDRNSKPKLVYDRVMALKRP
jgi:endo-1,4-beta-xylanase